MLVFKTRAKSDFPHYLDAKSSNPPPLFSPFLFPASCAKDESSHHMYFETSHKCAKRSLTSRRFLSRDTSFSVLKEISFIDHAFTFASCFFFFFLNHYFSRLGKHRVSLLLIFPLPKPPVNMPFHYCAIIPSFTFYFRIFAPRELCSPLYYFVAPKSSWTSFCYQRKPFRTAHIAGAYIVLEVPPSKIGACKFNCFE